MLKKWMAVLVAVFYLFTCMPVMAEDNVPGLIQETITVTERGGKFEVGFVTLQFPNKWIDLEGEAEELTVRIYAEKNELGEVKVYIDIDKDLKNFNKEVHIKVDSYQGKLLEQSEGKLIDVKVKKQQIKVDHFSRYAFL